jgi:hypothetical protein
VFASAADDLELSDIAVALRFRQTPPRPNQRDAQRRRARFQRDIPPAVGETKERISVVNQPAPRDPYRMPTSFSTAAASRNARRSAPSEVTYRFRRPAS